MDKLCKKIGHKRAVRVIDGKVVEAWCSRCTVRLPKNLAEAVAAVKVDPPPAPPDAS